VASSGRRRGIGVVGHAERDSSSDAKSKIASMHHDAAMLILGVAREKEAKADVVEPARGVVEGDERGGGVRCGGLMPERGARDL
ncbi:MAG: hypothetical protein WB524_14195, partial [Acidobacteriaceae bacterium]